MYILYWYLSHMLSYWSTAVYFGNYSSKCMKKVLQNQIIYTPIVGGSIYSILPYVYFPISIYNCVWQIPSLILLTDFFFYIFHRMFHSKFLYHYHKTHHIGEFSGAAALYADGLEHCFVNTIPQLIPVIITRCDPILIGIWIMFISANTVSAHAKEGQHTIHHKFRDKNFGAGFMLMDKFFCTYKN